MTEATNKVIYSFIGLPASGKGTQAHLLAEKHKIRRIVGVGDLVRDIMEEDENSSDPFVKSIKERYDAGIPQPDDVAIDLVRRYLGNSTTSVIFDNFPFTSAQADFVEEWIESHDDWDKHVIIYIHVDPEEAVKRAITRKVCTECGAIFGTTDEMICEKCGGSLMVRADDNEDTMRKRIEVYLPHIKEVLEYYRRLGDRIIEVDGNKPVAEVTAEIESKL
jgi:adenylate kinase